MTLHKDVMLDFARDARTGLEEAVLCASKSVSHLSVILEQVQEKGRPMLLTRLLPEQFAALSQSHRAAIDYDPISRTGFFGGAHELRVDTRIAVVAAGTSDVAVRPRVHCVSTASRLPRSPTSASPDCGACWSASRKFAK